MKKKNRKCIILINQPNKIYIYFFALSYSAHLYIDVHCSKSSKILAFASTAAA